MYFRFDCFVENYVTVKMLLMLPAERQFFWFKLTKYIILPPPLLCITPVTLQLKYKNEIENDLCINDYH